MGGFNLQPIFFCPLVGAIYNQSEIIMRKIVEMEGLIEVFPSTKHQVYKFVKMPDNPLPHKKLGRRLVFDVERVYKWFDALPGRDHAE